MSGTNIIDLFLDDHKKINLLLESFNSELSRGSSMATQTFQQLFQSLVRHFHQEEILYSNYRNTTGEIIPVIKTIRKEHEIILGKLSKIKNALEKGSTEINISKLAGLLERHKNVEDRLLYPELDRILSETEKENIYWKMQVK